MGFEAGILPGVDDNHMQPHAIHFALSRDIHSNAKSHQPSYAPVISIVNPTTLISYTISKGPRDKSGDSGFADSIEQCCGSLRKT